MAKLTSGQVTKINKMNKASQTPALGSIVSALQTAIGASGSYVATSVNANGSSIAIPVSISGSLVGGIVQMNRSGSTIVNYRVGFSGSTISILPASGSAILTGDVVNYIVF